MAVIVDRPNENNIDALRSKVARLSDKRKAPTSIIMPSGSVYGAQHGSDACLVSDVKRLKRSLIGFSSECRDRVNSCATGSCILSGFGMIGDGRPSRPCIMAHRTLDALFDSGGDVHLLFSMVNVNYSSWTGKDSLFAGLYSTVAAMSLYSLLELQIPNANSMATDSCRRPATVVKQPGGSRAPAWQCVSPG